MNAVEEAARIAEARFAALATSVYAMDPITGDLAWKNNKIAAGQQVLVGWGFGTYDPATDSFTFMVYQVEGVLYICGSVLLSPAPAQGSSNTAHIQSYAPNVGEAATFDAYCFIASGALSVLSQDWGSGPRIIGFSWTDFQGLSLIAVRVFEDLLTVSPPPVTYFTLTMSISGQGSTVPGPGSYSYPAGDWAWLTATPASGWAFSHFLVNGVSSHYENPYPLYMDSDKTVVALFYEEAPPGDTVPEQLASCWPYISGGGVQVDNLSIWALRGGVYLMYNSILPGQSNLESFMAGDVASLYLTQACTLIYDGKTQGLVAGWNNFTW